jgi:hypothetical protein
LSWSGYYAWIGNQQKAIAHLQLFAKEDNLQYWSLFLADDPVYDGIKSIPEFKKAVSDIEKKFWDNHNKLKLLLEEKGLL